MFDLKSTGSNSDNHAQKQRNRKGQPLDYDQVFQDQNNLSTKKKHSSHKLVNPTPTNIGVPSLTPTVVSKDSSTSSGAGTTDLNKSLSFKERRRLQEEMNNREERDYVCGCGKEYMSYAALFTHCKIKHNSTFCPGTMIKRKNGLAAVSEFQPTQGGPMKHNNGGVTTFPYTVVFCNQE